MYLKFEMEPGRSGFVDRMSVDWMNNKTGKKHPYFPGMMGKHVV
jgi:hypothetical protein